MLENYFLCLDFDVKKSIFRKCKPKPTTTTKDKHSPPLPIQNPDQEEGKYCHHCYVATTTHKKSTITHTKPTKTPPPTPLQQQQNKRSKTKIMGGGGWFKSERKSEIRERRPLWSGIAWGKLRRESETDLDRECHEWEWKRGCGSWVKAQDRWHAVSNPALVGQKERERRQIGERRQVGTGLTLGISLPSSFGLAWVSEESGHWLKVKSLCKIISKSKDLHLWSTEIYFQFNHIFICTQTHSRV